MLYVHTGLGQCFQNPDVRKPELVGQLVGLAMFWDRILQARVGCH